MSARILRFAAVMIAAVILFTAAASALSANVVMKVSRTAQDSIINEGEDLLIDVVLEGIEPASYVWYFEDEVIPGAVFRSYTIASATVLDAGTYRIEAFGEDGGMLVSMEFSVRVIEKALPKSGDNTMGFGSMAAIMGAMGLAITGAAVKAKKHAA